MIEKLAKPAIKATKIEVKIKRFPLVSASTMTVKPIQIEWLVENFLEQGSLNLLFGEPASGKSLFALDWAFCMAANIDWHDYRTKQTDVVIIAGEGHAGMQRRLKALEHKYSIPSPEKLYISQMPAQLLDEKNAELVANSIKALCSNPGLVIIDTLHRNMDGDENSSQDIGTFINHIDYFLKPMGAAVLIVHHSGHGNKDRSRGSSSIRAAMDAEFSANKNKDVITLTCHKAKDFEAVNPLSFILKPIELEWLNSDGDPMTSVYLESTDQASLVVSGSSFRNSKNLKELDNALIEFGIEPSEEIKLKFSYFNSPIGLTQKIINDKDWRKSVYAANKDIGKSTDALRVALNRDKKRLIEQGAIVESDGYVWRSFEQEKPEQ
jgi:hypothetical protein